MEVGYKIIEVKYKPSLKESFSNMIKDLSLNLPPEDAYFEYEKNILRAHIKAIDLSGFKHYVQTVTKKYELDNSKNPLIELVHNIEKIRSYGIKGKKRIFVGYNKERKVKGRERKEKKRGIYFYAQDNTFNNKNNELPEKYLNQIICGDSGVILKELPDNCIDIIFTSPPYNFGLDYHKADDGFSWNSYFEKLFIIFDECIRVLKYGGRIIVNIQPLFSDYIPSHHIISAFFMKHKLIWRGEILWEKNNYNCKYTAWGSWRSPSSPYLKYTWEFLEIFAKGTLKKEGEKKNIDIGKEEFKKWVVSKWSIAPERNMKKYAHPAMFPEELVERVLKLFSYKNDIVLDPFNGVGTTSVVARKLQRKYLGIDISEDYCRKAKERIKEILF